MVLKVVSTLHQEMADTCGFNLSSICGGVYIQILEYKERESPPQSRRRGSGCSGSRERKTANFTENTLPRGLLVNEVLRQVMSDSDNEEEYSHSDDDVQSSRESESAGASLRSGSESMRHDSHQAAHASPQRGRGVVGVIGE